MPHATLWIALALLLLAPPVGADTIEATASTSGSATFVSYLSTPGPGFSVQFAPLPGVINDGVDTTGSGTGSTGGFATHDAVDPNDVQPGESISWETFAMASAGAAVGTADAFFDVAGEILFVNSDTAPVDVRIRFDYSVAADATVDGPTASGFTFTDFQIVNPDVSDFFVFAEFGEAFSDSLVLDLTVPAADQSTNGVLGVPFFSGSTLQLAVPEPRAPTLLAIGLVGLLGPVRRRLAAIIAR